MSLAAVDIPLTFLEPLLAKGIPLFGIFVFIGLAKWLYRRPGATGARGERRISRHLKRHLPRAEHSVHDDLYLPRPDGNGTTQIDHLIVSRRGIFVIETKNLDGWIFGDERSPQWTQVIYRRKHRFQNPLHQNALHVKAVEKLFSEDIPLTREALHSLVVFTGSASLKFEAPGNVICNLPAPWILRHADDVLSANDCERIRARIAEIQANTDRRTRREHVRRAKARN